MTVVKDFIGGIANKWLEDNIKKSFGKSIEKTNMYIARVLWVEDHDPDPDTPRRDFDLGFVGGTYKLRCRILSMANMGWDNRDPKETNNPHAMFPDPCDLSAADAKGAIFRHPTYTPLDAKLKKPYVGDLIRITHEMLWVENFQEHAGHYVGYVVASPAMKIPPSKAGRRARGNHPKPSKPKAWAEGENPPRRYAGKKLAEIAEQAAFAINNTGKSEWLNVGFTKSQLLSSKFRQRGEYLDARLRKWKPVDKDNLGEDVGSYAGIPKSWYTPGDPQFQALQRFILYVSDGYPGMPNEKMRKYLVNKDSKTPNVDVGPDIGIFAKDVKYWRLFWTGRNTINSAPLFGLWQTIAQRGIGPTYKVRYGFGSFKVGDAGLPGSPRDLATNKYFPMVKEKVGFTNIKYAGVKGIGDPVCEMYALMMFIKLNFGSPHQFDSMSAEAEKIEAKAGNDWAWALDAKRKCLKEKKDRPTKVGTYTILWDIMPESSPFRCGMYKGHPPLGEG